MKKFIILLLSIFLAMSLAACGNKTDSRDSSGKTEIKDCLLYTSDAADD